MSLQLLESSELQVIALLSLIGEMLTRFFFAFQGAIASKTVMGVPFYGRTFNLVNPHDARMGARSTKTGFPGPYTKENGFMGYNEICEAMQDPDEVKNWVEEWDETSAAPFAYNGIKWVGYDNPKSLNKKVSKRDLTFSS